MGQPEDDLLLRDELRKLLGLWGVERHWLVAHDVKSGFDSCLGDVEVGVVRGGDRHEVDLF